ncbi:MAG: OmpA family protein [Pacificimonas sp.]
MAYVYRASFLAAALLIGGCASKSTFVLLPEDDGSVGEVTVSNAGGTRTMSGAYWAVDVADAAAPPDAPDEVDAAYVQARFGDTLSATPREPLSLILYFGSTAEDLTAESEAEIDQIVAAYGQYASPEIRVIGHTDTTGGADANDALSLERAQAIRDKLVAEGVPSDIIEIASHGESDLLIDTADETREPRNRRVEVTIR